MKTPLLKSPLVAAIGVVGACAACCAAPLLFMSFASGASLLGAGALGWLGLESSGFAKSELVLLSATGLLAVGLVMAVRVYRARRVKACGCASASAGTGDSCKVNFKEAP